MMLNSDETEIRGAWLVHDGKIEADEACHRIERLIRDNLNMVGRDATGWDVLYVDPRDGRYWELTYPQGEMQGGGPPSLRRLDEAEAQEKYAAAFSEKRA